MSKITIQKLEDLEANVLRGVFPYVRLCTVDGEVIVSAKKTRGKSENIRAHWSFIRQKLEYELPDGEYCIECAYDSARKNVHQYLFTKQPGYVPEAKPVPELPKANVKMDKDYISTIKENAELGAENRFLTEQNRLLSQRITELEAALSEALEDSEESQDLSEGNTMVKGLTEIWTQAAPMLDHFFALKNRELELKYGGAPQQNGQGIKKKIPVSNPAQSSVYQEQFQTLDQMFNDGRETEANEILAHVYNTNRPLFDQLCKDLNLEDA